MNTQRNQAIQSIVANNHHSSESIKSLNESGLAWTSPKVQKEIELDFLVQQSKKMQCNYLLTINCKWTASREEVFTVVRRFFDMVDRKELSCREPRNKPLSERTQFVGSAEKIRTQSHVHLLVNIRNESHRKTMDQVLDKLKKKRMVLDYDFEFIYNNGDTLHEYLRKENRMDEMAILNCITMADIHR